MSGIAGFIDYTAQRDSHRILLGRMLNSIHTPGTEPSGIWMAEHAALIQVNTTASASQHTCQPIAVNWHGGEYVLGFDGEVYNADVIQSLLEDEGVRFQTSSHEEIVLRAYLQWGFRCLDAFNGAYAFTVWDSQKEELFLTRDRLGIKPLYYAAVKDGLVFGSSINGILQHPLIAPRIDVQGISEILLLGPGHTPGCGVFQGINELKAGQYAVFSRNGIRYHSYWKLKDCENTDTFDQTVEKVRWLVQDAIKHQAAYPESAGALLTGKVDADIVAAIASHCLAEKEKLLHTFSVKYTGTGQTDPPTSLPLGSIQESIQDTIDCLDSMHTTAVITPEETADALYDAVLARGLPGMAGIDSSLLMFCHRIKPEVDMVLLGEGAEVIFGGYPWFREQKPTRIYSFPWSQNMDYRLSFLNDDIAASIDSQKYITNRYRQSIALVDIADDPSPIERRMKEMMYLHIRWYLPVLLDRIDRMSRFSGLNIRLPFCDYRLVEALYTIPWDYKDYNGQDLGLLRKAMEDLLPQEILWKPKIRSSQMSHPLYTKIVSSRLREVIANPSSPILTLVKKSELEKLLSSQISKPWYGRMKTLSQTISYFLQIDYWLRKYHVEIC